MGTTNTDLNLVRAFIAIYETGSVSAAAQRLNLTQPSVSYALARLRTLLHDSLFTRTRTGMEPTFNASQLYETFRQALDRIEGVIAATQNFVSGTSNRCFRLALSDLGELYFLPRMIERLQSVAPGVELEVVQLDVEKAADWLNTGHIDAAVGNLGFVGGQARRRRLFTETYSCLVSRKHPRIKKMLSLEEYVGAKHVVGASSSGHNLVDDAMVEMGLSRKVILRVPHITNLSEVVAHSDLVLTLPTRIAKAFSDEGLVRVLPLPIAIKPFDVNLYWQERAADTSAQNWFCNLIADVLTAV
ncbi:LysR family transcriptional regulator [Paraburkholderia sediminicola]|uniref:LysR family transcriptional regulator n=1 Tax=Paraburkholderia sediminicola TaxID=458836 RepID=UPI0038BA1C3C